MGYRLDNIGNSNFDISYSNNIEIEYRADK